MKYLLTLNQAITSSRAFHLDVSGPIPGVAASRNALITPFRTDSLGMPAMGAKANESLSSQEDLVHRFDPEADRNTKCLERCAAERAKTWDEADQ